VRGADSGFRRRYIVPRQYALAQNQPAISLYSKKETP